MEPRGDGSSVALFGATGLVGRHCLRLLVEEPGFDRIVVAGRRPLPNAPIDSRLEEHVIDFDRLAEHPEVVSVASVICALGTTIRKAGSRERFRAVDHDYPLAIARLALAQGARHFSLVSTLGADPGSRVFYNRVKGEVETAISALGFPSLTIVRPSVLLGERDEFRLGEEVAKRLRFLFPARFKPVEAESVARLLVAEALSEAPETRVVESREIISRFG